MNSASSRHNNIGQVLRSRASHILKVWEERVRGLINTSDKESSPTLIDHLPNVLSNLADAFEDKPFNRNLGIEHAKQRANWTDFSLEEIVKEYGILRQVIMEELTPTNLLDQENAQIFHQFLDDVIELAVGEFVNLTKAALELERQNFEHLFQNSECYIGIFKGPEHIYDYLNPTHIKILGSDVTGKSLQEVVPDVYKSGLIKKYDNVLNTGVTEVIDEIPLIVGNELRYFNAIYVPWRNERGEIEGVMTLGNDVTQEVRARKKIEESVSSLRTERELRERFVAALTHDLRTPLTASKVSAQLILRKTDLEQLQKLASRIVSNMNRADDMIRDLLDASRINAGESLPLEIGECDLHNVIISTLDDLASVHGDRFVFQSPGTVKGFWDCSVLRRIIENLCNNAVKYGSGMSPITVRLKKREDLVELDVHNEGNPISPEDQQHIFRPYQRLKSAVKSSQKGWGIGLTLVHGFTEALGGTAKVESSAEEGTTFYVCLPHDSREGKV